MGSELSDFSNVAMSSIATRCARADLRWIDMAYFLLNMDSQLKWYPLVTAEMLADLSREFWRG
jgi:hypothetical protein